MLFPERLWKPNPRDYEQIGFEVITAQNSGSGGASVNFPAPIIPQLELGNVYIINWAHLRVYMGGAASLLYASMNITDLITGQLYPFAYLTRKAAGVDADTFYNGGAIFSPRFHSIDCQAVYSGADALNQIYFSVQCFKVPEGQILFRNSK